MADETKTITIECPNCQKAYRIDVPVEKFEKSKQKGIVTIALVAPCGHACQIFVDPKWKFRGGQAADILLESSQITSIEGDASASPISDEKADLMHKVASDVIITDARDYAWIKSLGAEEKIDIAELALLTGDKDAARCVFSDLAEFAASIDDEEFANSMKERITKVGLLFNPDETIDYDAVLTEVEAAANGDQSSDSMARRIDRFDSVLVNLKLANVTGDISNAEHDYKRARLLEIKEKLA